MNTNRVAPAADCRLRPTVTLAVGLFLGLAPLASWFPVWLAPLLLVLSMWRISLEISGKPLPARWFLLTVAVLGSAAVLATARSPNAPDATLGILALLTALKLLEARTPRDRAIVAFVGYFVVLANFLYRDSMGTAALMTAVVTLLTVALIDTADEQGTRPLPANLKLALAMMCQATPIAAALFLLFPRIGAPVWGAARPPASAQSGLSDEMVPGSISRLALSDDVAFRATLDQAPPPALYWRGPVLEATDGRRWSVRPGPDTASADPGLRGGTRIEQTIMQEPGTGTWLMGLDLPVKAPPQARFTAAQSLRAHRPVAERLRYAVVSVSAESWGARGGGSRSGALDVPSGVSARVRALAETWRVGATSETQIVDHALRYFGQGSFVYTLEPPLLGRDPVDQFLFETRRGFCEHYAGAFSLLMRLAGVPARVVTGYLGGEWNPLGGYWIVRQADAHAWSEVWLQGKGWVRVDPTARVAPARVAAGNETQPAGLVRFLPTAAGRLRLWLRLAWDSVDNGWNQWVLGYGSERQIALLTRLGFDDVTWQKLTLVLAAVLLGLLAFAGFQFGRRRMLPDDPARALYARYCRRLARNGLPRRPSEGPGAFGERISLARPDLAPLVRQVTDAYETLRYARPPRDRRRARELLRCLRRAVRELRP